MSSVKLSDLKLVNTLVKQQAKAADEDGDKTLTASEIEVAGYQFPDGYAASQAFQSIAGWARQGKTDADLSVSAFNKAADKALGLMKARDANGDGVLEGAELTAAQRLKTFDAYATVLPKVAGSLVDGEDFNALRDRCTQLDEVKYTSAKEVPEALGQAIIAAANESTYASKSLEDVFGQVDQNEVIVRSLQDNVTKKLYLTVDYGAGDNTYGAVFDGSTLEKLAGIHDSELDASSKPRP